MQYKIGQLLRVKTTFTDTSKAVFDPSSVKFQVRKPSKAVDKYDSPTRDSAGVYEIHVPLNAGGTWWYRAVGYDSEGNPIAADEGPIEVIRSKF